MSKWGDPTNSGVPVGFPDPPNQPPLEQSWCQTAPTFGTSVGVEWHSVPAERATLVPNQNGGGHHWYVSSMGRPTM